MQLALTLFCCLLAVGAAALLLAPLLLLEYLLLAGWVQALRNSDAPKR